MRTPLMTPLHPSWLGFVDQLTAACDFRYVGPGPENIRWNCDHDLRRARKLLESYGVDVLGSLQYFRLHGGFCDCEVLFNVDQQLGDELDNRLL